MSNLRQRKHIDARIKSDERKDEDVKPNARWALLGKLAIFVFIILPLTCLLACIVLIESPIEPELVTNRLPEPPKLEGPLALNDLLVFQGERLFEGQVIGAESLIHQSGYLYTGTADGKILRIDLTTKTMETLVTLGPPPCGQITDEVRCGRPLGMRFDKDGYLIVVDAYLGMYKINVASREVFQLLPGSMIVDGQQFRFLNSLDIALDGTIYFTDTSRFRRKDFILDFLEGNANGRLLKYDPVTNNTEVLCKKLYFANGVQLSKDNSYLLVSETTKSRILKYHLTGPKQGKVEKFIENLPGIPDNIRRNSGGGYWVALGTCRNAQRVNLLDILQDYPWIRKQLAKIPERFLSTAISSCTLIIELDEQGNIIRSLHDPDGERFSRISEVEEHAGHLYIGSFCVPYIGKVNTYKKPGL